MAQIEHQTAFKLHAPTKLDEPFIWVDLDRVIFDWEAATLERLPHFSSLKELNKHPDYERILRNMYVNSPNFFLNLPLTDFAVDLITIVESFGIQWGFLSAIGTVHPSPSSVAVQKYTALNNACSTWGDRLTLVPDSIHKQLYARPTSCLIDDYLKNILQWEDKGGHAAHINSIDDVERVFHKLLDFTIAYGYQAEHIREPIKQFEAMTHLHREGK